jgi:hypothetical protein
MALTVCGLSGMMLRMVAELATDELDRGKYSEFV